MLNVYVEIRCGQIVAYNLNFASIRCIKQYCSVAFKAYCQQHTAWKALRVLVAANSASTPGWRHSHKRMGELRRCAGW